METLPTSSVPRNQSTQDVLAEGLMKRRISPAVRRKIPIPNCLGPPARKTDTSEAIRRQERARNDEMPLYEVRFVSPDSLREERGGIGFLTMLGRDSFRKFKEALMKSHEGR
jgi:hypothetical protein